MGSEVYFLYIDHGSLLGMRKVGGWITEGGGGKVHTIFDTCLRVKFRGRVEGKTGVKLSKFSSIYLRSQAH